MQTLRDLFPDIFDFENYSAVSSERLRELQTALQNAHGVEMLSTPAVIQPRASPLAFPSATQTVPCSHSACGLIL